MSVIIVNQKVKEKNVTTMPLHTLYFLAILFYMLSQTGSELFPVMSW